jgi:hypothetical protein
VITPAAEDAAPFDLLSDDFNADIGSTAHADGMSSTETQINRCAIPEWTAIIDADDHRPIGA